VIPATFWADSKAGAFERYLMCDVWNYLHENFSIRPDREGHSITGVSMGGGAAIGLAIKYKERFKTAVGLMPLVNIRYVDCQAGTAPTSSRNAGRCASASTAPSARQTADVHARFNTLFAPLYGRGEKAICGMSEINPMEIMEREELRNGELNLYIAYGGKDQFNIAAQVESFLYRARERGIDVTVDYDPDGRHDLATGLRMFPRAVAWSSAHASTP